MIEYISENGYYLEYIDFLRSFNINPDIVFVYVDKIEIFFFDRDSDNYYLNLESLNLSNDFDNMMESIKLLNFLNIINNRGYSDVLILEKKNISLYDLFYFSIKMDIDELRNLKLSKLDI
jgi:hypothetical protein